MSQQQRPGQKELFAKVQLAWEALQAGRYQVGVPEHLTSDLEELQIECQAAFWALLPALLAELKAAGPGGCYTGWRPEPERSVEPTVRGCKLWAFAWDSAELGCRIYLKFCLKENNKGEQHYLHVRVHKDRPPRPKI